MKALITAAITAATAAAAYGLPGDVVVISDKEVRPDEAAGLYYLGQAGGGYLYNGSSAAVGAVAPYRLLDRDAQVKDYYIVWAPEWVTLTPEAFAHLGAAVRLSDTEILVGLERGLGPSDLRAVEHRIELIKLAPVTPVDWRVDAEEPPTKKDPRIEAAVNTITAEEYAGYIQKLQDFKTRWTDTPGCDAARDYLRGFFASYGASSSLFPFKAIKFYGDAFYPEPGKNIYVGTDHGAFKRSKSAGDTWDAVWPLQISAIASSFWLDADTGFVAGYKDKMAKTVDGGETWELVRIDTGKPHSGYCKPSSIDFLNRNTGWLGGEVLLSNDTIEGFVIKTDDGGRTWAPQKLPSGFVPTVVDFIDGAHGWAVSRQGNTSITYTNDGGATWRPALVPDSNKVVDLQATGPTDAWATDYYGKLLRTSDGLNWGYFNTGAAGVFKKIEFCDASHGYVAGVGIIIKTDNGGVSWRELVDAPQIAFDLLAFADKDHGLVGDFEANNLYRTDDGGATFVSVIDNVDLMAENVIGERRGNTAPEEIVIICGHFDCHSVENAHYDAPGAEDNGSGAACAMAAARAFKDVAFSRTVRYVAFGAEESGLLGSDAYARACAAKGENIVAVLNADMVSYDEEKGARDDFSVACEENKWLLDYLKRVGALYGNNLVYDPVESIGSDQISFWRAGYAALGVIEGREGPGGSTEYPYYHTTEDTLDKLQPDLGVRFVRDYAAMLAHLAGITDVGVNDPRPVAAVPFTRAFAVYPNPYCYASTAGGVTFVGIKSPATVRIYDLAGRRVASAAVAGNTDEFVWRPGGEALSPGVYLYRVEGREQHKSGKIVLTR